MAEPRFGPDIMSLREDLDEAIGGTSVGGDIVTVARNEELLDAIVGVLNRRLMQVQVETLREAADDVYAPDGPGLHLSTQAWLRRRADRLEQGALPEPAPWEHPNHKPIQHRDGHPPWCDECGWSSPKPMQPARFYRGVSDA